MALLDEIKAKCSADLIASRDHQAIADAVNVERTRPSNTEIGNGTILEVLGKAKGNVVLDLVYADTSNKYVVPLLEQGRLKACTKDFQDAVDQLLLAGVLTQEQADALKALGTVPDPVTAHQVNVAMCTDSGEWRI